jgi:hypothetical protein
MQTTNGSSSPFRAQEWESQEMHEWEGSPEWEGAHEWEGTHESSMEWEGANEGSMEWEGSHEGSPEWEGSHEWEGSQEWEGSHEGAMEWEGSTEADPFLPFLAPVAARAIPAIARAAAPHARRLLPVARRAMGAVVRSVLAPSGRSAVSMSGGGGAGGRRTALRLVRRLYGLIQRGEAEAAEAEAAFFGSAEMEWEVGSHPAAEDAALTEVLAAEAAHTASEAEAEALLGAALPVTIRIIAGRRSLRRITPALVQANARLVRGLRRSGPAGPQLLRTVPTIQRRTVASLKAMQRSGRPVRPTMVAPLMAAHAAKVLGTPRACGPALVRNTVIRQRSVAPRPAR